MGVDEHRHHGLAGEADALGAGGHLHVGGSAGLGDPGAVDDDRSVLDHAAVADDDPGALIGRLRMGGDGKSCEDTKGNCRDRGYVHSVHWKPPDIYSWTAIL